MIERAEEQLEAHQKYWKHTSVDISIEHAEEPYLHWGGQIGFEFDENDFIKDIKEGDLEPNLSKKIRGKIKF